MIRTFNAKPIVFTGFFVVMLLAPAIVNADTGISYDVALQKAIRYTRARNYKQSMKYFKLAVSADATSMDPYFNVGSLAEHFKECKDQLLYFRGFLYLANQGGATASFLKSAKKALKRCARDKKTGYFSIVTEPPGLEVTINGALAGKTPLHKLPLTAGKYTYAISNPLFQPFQAEVEIKAKETSEVKPQLVKKIFYGWLEFKPVPKKGVEVFIDHKAAGVTPLKKVRLKTGNHLIRLKAKGYDTWQRYMDVSKDMTTTVNAQMEKPIVPKKLNMDRWKKFKE